MKEERDEDSIIRRNTKQKTLVLETVREHTDHPTAEDIYLDVRARDPHVSKGTVYRNLKELSRTGEVNHIKVPGADRYDLRTDFHYHIMCVHCLRVTDVPVGYESALDCEAGKATGYSVYRHRTVFEGVCPECLERGLK